MYFIAQNPFWYTIRRVHQEALSSKNTLEQ